MTSKLKCLEIIEVDTDEPIEDKAEENEVEILDCPNVKSSMCMESLVDLNKKALHDKLANVDTKKLKNGTVYNANDVIDILSTHKDRDKRLINDYSNEEVLILKSKRKGYLRSSRFFTITGISRYLLEGKIFAYKNACSFFNIEPQNIEYIKYNEQLCNIKDDNGAYNTKALLKWLFGKRKSFKLLGDSCSIIDVLAFFGEDQYVDPEKIKYLEILADQELPTH